MMKTMIPRHKQPVLLLWLICLLVAGLSTASAQEPIPVQVNQQYFENGRMLYFTHNGLIAVLVNGGQAYQFQSTQYGFLPDNPIPHVPGAYRAINGFGRVWGNIDGVRDALGAPISPESSFEAAVYGLRGATLRVSMPDGVPLEIGATRWLYVDGVTPPIAPPTASPAPFINQFEANPDPAYAGDFIIIRWDVVGVDGVDIQIHDANNRETAPFYAYMDEAPQGSIRVDIPADMSVDWLISMDATKRNPNGDLIPIGVSASQRLEVLGQVTQRVYAAYQPFQNGLMLWREDTGAVYVLHKSTEVQVYHTAVYNAWLTNPDVYVRENFVRPQNAFGRIWSNLAELREYIGFATDHERGYEATLGLGGRFNYSMTLPDGRVVLIDEVRKSWAWQAD